MIVATEVRHFDVDATEFGYELGQVPQMPAVYKSVSICKKWQPKSTCRITKFILV